MQQQTPKLHNQKQNCKNCTTAQKELQKSTSNKHIINNIMQKHQNGEINKDIQNITSKN